MSTTAANNVSGASTESHARRSSSSAGYPSELERVVESTKDGHDGRGAGGLLRISDSVTLILGDSHTMKIEADAVISDPPYGINLNTDYTGYRDGKNGVRGRGDLRKKHAPVIGDSEPFDPSRWLGYGIVMLWGANNFSDKLPVGSWLFWDKRADNGHALKSEGEAGWIKGGRMVYYFDHCWHGFARASENSEHHHPTQKPVALMGRAMDCAKVPVGATVLDPYMGSGSTALACIRTGRKFIGIECDPKHFETAVQRVRRELEECVFEFPKGQDGGGQQQALELEPRQTDNSVLPKQ